MVIGDQFPTEQKLQYIRKQLIPGVVFYLFCDFTIPHPKDKFLLLTCVNPKLLFFVINSRINQFIQEQQHLLRCQVQLDMANHTFLKHDSYIDCTTAYSISRDDVEDQLSEDMSRVKGKITGTVKDNLIVAVQGCIVLPKREKRWILEAFR